jgi:FkbM family methyltransferase
VRNGATGRLRAWRSRQAARVVRAEADAVARRISQPRVVPVGGTEVLVRRVDGTRLWLDMRDLAVAPSLALGEPYEPGVERVLQTLARPTDTFVDAGANFGYHSLRLAPRLDGGARGTVQLHLFEPHPDVHRCLRRSILLNGLASRVAVNAVALGDEVATATLTVPDDLWGGSTLVPVDVMSRAHDWTPYVGHLRRIEVPTTTLDAYCDERGVGPVHLMKVDVEGGEPALFAGMRGVLARSPELAVVMEFTFGAYADPAAFWDSLCEAFPSRWTVPWSGAPTPVRTYAELRASSVEDLVNVLLSRRPLP